MKVFPKNDGPRDPGHCVVRKLLIPYKSGIEDQLKIPTYEIIKDDLLSRVLVFSMSGSCIVDMVSKSGKCNGLAVKL